MTLQELYDGSDVKEKIENPKKVMLLVSTADVDVLPYVGALGLDRFEVCVTWPKVDAAFMLREIEACSPELVVQIGERVSRKYPLVESPSEAVALTHRAAQAVGDRFVNLHHHDEFSIRDGLGTVGGLVKLLKSRGGSFCAITNHGHIGGWIKQYSTCRKNGVKALFGMEAYLNDYRGDDPDERKRQRGNHHLVLLARNEVGFYNILRIHNDAQLEGFYYRPRATHEALKKWGEGVIGLSACYAGELVQYLMADDMDGAKRAYEFYVDAFDEFYIELTMIEMEDQIEANKRLIEFADDVGAPLVVTLDSHYLKPEHTETHDVLLLIKSGKTVFDKIENPEEVWQFDARNIYYRSGEQLRELWGDGFAVGEDGDQRQVRYKSDVFTEAVFDAAMENTRRIAMECEEIELDSEFKLPTLYEDGNSVLRKKAQEGFKRRALKGRRYSDRLHFELDTVCHLGFSDYFLVVDKIVTDAKEKFGEFAINWGRGSAAGSLVSYCLEITDLDPLEYGLFFERFLDYSRVDDCPDIDLDFDPRIRDWVKEHVVELFGSEKTCSIGTYQTYKTRAVVVDVSRALGLDVWTAMEVTKQIDTLAKFDVETDEGTEEQKIDEMGFDEVCKHYPELKAYFDANPEVLKHAEVLRNQVKNAGKHAGGMIISNLELQDRVPMFRDSSGAVVSAWSEGLATHELSEVGLVKFDILGLKNLCVISDCLDYVESTRGVRIRRADIDINNREAIKLQAKHDCVGIFQFESPGTKPVIDAVGVDSIFDISAVTSLIRPGPKNMGMDQVYARRKHGEPYEMIPVLRDVLSETYGVITYQEDVMRVAQVFAGFTPIESNQLRSAIAKKRLDKLPAMKEKFIAGAQARVDDGEVTEAQVLEIWNLLESFGGYGFNRSVDKNTLVRTIGGGAKRISDFESGDWVWCYDGSDFVPAEVVELHDHGTLESFEVAFDDGSRVVCSINHKFLTPCGMLPLWMIVKRDLGVLSDAGSEKRRMEMQGLRGSISNAPIAAPPQARGQLRFAEGWPEWVELCGMWQVFSCQEGAKQSSKSMSESHSDCQGESKSCGVEKPGESQSVHVNAGGQKITKDGRCKGFQESGFYGISEGGAFCDSFAIESDRRIQKKGVRNGGSYVGKTRYSSPASGCACELAERSPRRANEKLGKGNKSSEGIKGRGMDGRECVVGFGFQKERAGSLRRESQASRFRSEGFLDRDRRVLAFRRQVCSDSEHKIQPESGSPEGLDAESRGGETFGNLSSPGTGLLVGERKEEAQVGLVESLANSAKQTDSRSLAVRRVLSTRLVGSRHVYDLEVRHSAHNFVLANGVITSNSHAMAYSAVTAAEFWLKHKYPREYVTALLNNTPPAKKKKQSDSQPLMIQYVNYARRMGVLVAPPDINASGAGFRIEQDGTIRFALNHVKQVGSSAVDIEALQPFEDIADFYERVNRRRVNKRVVMSLVYSGAFDCFGARPDVIKQYYDLRKDKKSEVPDLNDRGWEKKEREVLNGLCLSKPTLRDQYKERVSQERNWCFISEVRSRNRAWVFGRVVDIEPRVSKNQNPYLFIELSDDIDNIKVFVFQNARDQFRHEIKQGYVAVIPVRRFEDDEENKSRFYDVSRQSIVLEK